MDSHDLSWAVQYEISRFRSQSKEDGFTLQEYARIFPDLRGGNDMARHVVHLLRMLLRDRREQTALNPELQAHIDAVKRDVEVLERAEKDPYVELDQEEAAIEAGKHAGLGLTSHGPNPDWYGGQGQFCICLGVELYRHASYWDFNNSYAGCYACQSIQHRRRHHKCAKGSGISFGATEA